MFLCIDTETTGLDVYHGCRPFLISCCNQDGELFWWEWEVNPFNRQPCIPAQDKKDFVSLLNEYPVYAFHNAKFDVRMLESIGIPWDDYWDKTHDTSLMAHAYRNDWSLRLNSLAHKLFAIPEDDEAALSKATISARNKAKKLKYNTARENHEAFPGMTEDDSKKYWKQDYWLPKQILRSCPDDACGVGNWCKKCEPIQHWDNVTLSYALRDVERTHCLYDYFVDRLNKANLYDQYMTRRKMLRITYRMSDRGITLRQNTIEDVLPSYSPVVIEKREEIINLTENFEIPLVKATSGLQVGMILHSLYDKQIQPDGYKVFKRDSAYGFDLPLETDDYTDTVQPKTGEKQFEKLLAVVEKEKYELEQDGQRLSRKKEDCIKFLNLILEANKLDKTLSFVDSYRKWKNVEKRDGEPTWVVHPNFNITGTKFTRQSSSNPNLQQVPKFKNERQLFNVRSCFGPSQDRIWLDQDYSNLELRIWAHACGNEELCRAFKEGVSVHLLIARELFPELREMTDLQASKTNQYGWTKNGNFSKLYGAGKKKSDITYHRPGATDIITAKFPETKSFIQEVSAKARKQGFIETYGGYRLHIPLKEPHKSVSAFIQGSAGYVMMLAMIYCDEFMEEYNKTVPKQERIHMSVQVHDQLVHDLHQNTPGWVAYKLESLMEKAGTDLGLVTPVDSDLIPYSWDKAIPLPIDQGGLKLWEILNLN